MPFILKPLPYPADALAPVISAESVFYHHDRLQAGYVEKLNQAVPSSSLGEDQTLALSSLIRSAVPGLPIFNAAAQVLNHETYWLSLRPGGAVMPLFLQRLIEREFGSVDGLQRKLVDAAVEQFGSGWVWLVALDNGPQADPHLLVWRTSNADTPVRTGLRPLLCIDVWEHAYYLDYTTERRRYAESILPLLDWLRAYDRLGGAP